MIKGKGGYRGYIQLTNNLGLKYARIKLGCWGNPLCGFLVSIVMNLMERRRYKYYVLKGGTKNSVFWDRKKKRKLFEKPKKDIISDRYINKLNKTYFSCGFFNIVEHCSSLSESDVEKDILFLNELVSDGKYIKDSPNKDFYLTNFTFHPSYQDFGRNKKGDIVALDYGDFILGGYNNFCIHYLDYR